MPHQHQHQQSKAAPTKRQRQRGSRHSAVVSNENPVIAQSAVAESGPRTSFLADRSNQCHGPWCWDVLSRMQASPRARHESSERDVRGLSVYVHFVSKESSQTRPQQGSPELSAAHLLPRNLLTALLHPPLHTCPPNPSLSHARTVSTSQPAHISGISTEPRMTVTARPDTSTRAPSSVAPLQSP